MVFLFVGLGYQAYIVLTVEFKVSFPVAYTHCSFTW